MPRHPIGDRPMTSAERQRRHRDRLREQGATPSRNVTKAKPRYVTADQIEALETRVAQLESIIGRAVSNSIKKKSPLEPETVKHPPTDDEIADFFWGQHYPGHVVGYKATCSTFSVERNRVESACEHESERRYEIHDLHTNHDQSSSQIAAAFNVPEAYVFKAISWAERVKASEKEREDYRNALLNRSITR